MKLSQPYIYSQLSLNGHLSKRELTIRVIFWHKNNVSGSDVADDIQVIDKTNLTDSSSVCDPFLSQRSLPSLSLPPTEVISRFSYKLNGIISINAVQLSNLLWNWKYWTSFFKKTTTKKHTVNWLCSGLVKYVSVVECMPIKK